jgi:hypothetical protein
MDAGHVSLIPGRPLCAQVEAVSLPGGPVPHHFSNASARRLLLQPGMGGGALGLE